MTSTPGESEALGHLVEPWAAKIAKSSDTTVEATVTHAENVRAALQELKPYGHKARQLLALRSGLSRPMMSKLETIGRHANLLRQRAGFLPPSVSSLYALARKPSPEFEQAVMMDLRGKSCAEIKRLFAPPSPPKPTRKLMTILVPPDLNEAARCLLIADIEAALARITENRGVDVEASPSARMLDAWQALSSLEQPPRLPDQPQEEQPVEPSSDDADEKLMDLEKPAVHDIVSEQQSRPKGQAEERGCAGSDAGHGARDMQQQPPDKVANAGERADGRAGAHNAHDQGFAVKPLGIEGRTMTQLEADQRLIRERIERLEAVRLRRGLSGSTAPEAQRRALPA